MKMDLYFSSVLVLQVGLKPLCQLIISFQQEWPVKVEFYIFLFQIINFIHFNLDQNFIKHSFQLIRFISTLDIAKLYQILCLDGHSPASSACKLYICLKNSVDLVSVFFPQSTIIYIFSIENTPLLKYTLIIKASMEQNVGSRYIFFEFHGQLTGKFW